MARKMPHVCSIPGCPELAYPPRFRCPAHEREYQQRQEAKRPNAHQRGYDHQWRRIRAAFLKANPYCSVCGAPATDAHHKIAKAEGGPDTFDNLIAFCGKHHKEYEAKHGRAFGRKELVSND